MTTTKIKRQRIKAQKIHPPPFSWDSLPIDLWGGKDGRRHSLHFINHAEKSEAFSCAAEVQGRPKMKLPSMSDENDFQISGHRRIS